MAVVLYELHSSLLLVPLRNSDFTMENPVPKLLAKDALIGQGHQAPLDQRPGTE